MTEEVRRHLFEAFFTTEEPGQAAGSIGAASEPGRGAAFTIYIPPLGAGSPAAAPSWRKAPHTPVPAAARPALPAPPGPGLATLSRTSYHYSG
jgi:hypothetical protein